LRTSDRARESFFVTQSETSFETLGLGAPILKALAAENYTNPTPIQTQAIPIVLSGSDLIGLAQTGTGKTAAFALPIIERLARNRRHGGARACRTLVLAPTRELAAQIADSFRAYGRFHGLSTAVAFGGASMVKQKHALSRGVDILVATPGRLLDHIAQRSLTLEAVEILVLDEADHMLDMGFIHDLRRIAQLLPVKRQSLFFSATMPPAIAELAGQFLHEPQRVAVAPQSTTAERVDQAVIHVEHGQKFELLSALLNTDAAMTRTLVFARTKHGANRLAERLVSAGHAADAIHGNRSQGQRERALDAFKKGRVRLLVATEIAARGIDVDDVSHVVNFDLPNVPEQYVHRIGRTARAGATGRAISFCAPQERAWLRDIEKLMRKQVPVQQHELSLRAPAQGEPSGEKKPQRRGGPQRNGAPHGQKRDGQKRDGQKERNGEQRNGQKRGEWQSRDGAVGGKPAAPHRAPGRPKPAPHAKRHEEPARHRDEGDRRDRKGNHVWSNAAPPRGRRNNGSGRRG